MKCLLLADDRLDLLATLEPILKHWGYRVLTATDVTQANAFLAGRAPAMLIIGSNLLNHPELQQLQPSLPRLVLKHPTTDPDEFEPDRTLSVPVDIFALFAFIQSQVEKHPRRNLRLRLHLPGMYRTKGEEFLLADVLSLSMSGLFFRSSLRLFPGDKISAVFPLLGHAKELEVEGTVLYIIEPAPENNYLQGFGLGFSALTPEQATQLERFIENSFLNEVAACQPGVGTFSATNLKR
ncbi:MAG: PilZ domain-containing protein [Desulfuromonadales bacterium]|nr:PilZ domain-containing protein [Desulfuromonadales bacterium]